MRIQKGEEKRAWVNKDCSAVFRREWTQWKSQEKQSEKTENSILRRGNVAILSLFFVCLFSLQCGWQDIPLYIQLVTTNSSSDIWVDDEGSVSSHQHGSSCPVGVLQIY